MSDGRDPVHQANHHGHHHEQDPNVNSASSWSPVASSAAADIANVVEGISWNTCFSHLQWYRKDIHFPLRVSQSVKTSTEARTHNQLNTAVQACTQDIFGRDASTAAEGAPVHRKSEEEQESKIHATLQEKQCAAVEVAGSSACYGARLHPPAMSLVDGEGLNASPTPLHYNTGFFSSECLRSDNSAAVTYGAVPGPFSLFGHYWRSRQVQDPENLHLAFQSSSNEWYEDRMAKAFSGVSVSEVAWLMTYISKAAAYIRTEIWMCQNCSMEQRLQRMMHGGNPQNKPRCCYMNRVSDAVQRPPKTSGMGRALRGVVHSSEDLRQMSDAARFVSCAVNNRARLWENSGMQSSMGPLYAHLSCRMLELAALMDEEDALIARLGEEEGRAQGEAQKSAFGTASCAAEQQPARCMNQQHSVGLQMMQQLQQHPQHLPLKQPLAFPSPSYYLGMNSPSVYIPCRRNGFASNASGIGSSSTCLPFAVTDASYEYIYPEN
jgi:hypothetical protein